VLNLYYFLGSTLPFTMNL